MLTGLLHCHGIHLVPGRFPPVGFSMQLPVAPETPSTIPTSLLVFVGNILVPLYMFYLDEDFDNWPQATVEIKSSVHE